VDEKKSPFIISRRDFLKGGAIGTAALSSGLLLRSEVEAQSTLPGAKITRIALKINGAAQTLEIDNRWTLLYILRDQLGLTGAKQGCDGGQCGACTVLIEGKPLYACMVLGIAAQGREILTIEGLAKDDALHPVQQAFVEEMGYQCAFCTPGMILSAKALLDRNPKPSDTDIRQGLAGNLCRCAAYPKIIRSVMNAARRIAS
jgi:aerobic-type carbon monoxide dehydrogenase small subunit (CoxS/CutS family)